MFYIFDSIYALLCILKNKTLRFAFKKTARIIKENFFELQKNALKNIELHKVKNVDHPLDALIPFTPKWWKVYHDFSPLWIRSAYFISKSAGVNEAALFIEHIGVIYERAALVYKQCLSTTKRPRYFGNLGCIIIQAFDPHLLCVPSLHVMVCVACFIWTRKGKQLSDNKKKYADKIYDRAVSITESILYMKQHSVNCIPCALYALTCIDEELFNIPEMISFLSALFLDTKKMEKSVLENRDKIISYMKSFYMDLIEKRKNLLLEGKDDWTITLIEFLSRAE